MNVGSLFSGIGGMDHGLHRAGFQHRFFCESDEWRRRVLAEHWPGVPIHEDVRDVGRAQCSNGPARETGRSSVALVEHQDEPDGELGRPDQRGVRGIAGGVPGDETGGIQLLCGGFPCQDLSVAGQRRGLAGDRSGLFFEFARIIDLVRPRWVLVENVPGLLSSNGGRDFGVVVGTLADLGYGVGWRVLDSRFFGVPQRRRRVFIVGAKSVGDPRAAAERAGQVLAVGSRCPGHPATRGEARQEVAPALSGRSASRLDDQGSGQLVPHYYVEDHENGPLRANGAGGPPRTDKQPLVTAFHQTQEPITGDDFSPAIGRTSLGMGVGQGTGVRRLTPRECERLQALPDDWTNHGPDSRRYAALGDAVTSSVAEWIGRQLMAVTA